MNKRSFIKNVVIGTCVIPQVVGEEMFSPTEAAELKYSEVTTIENLRKEAPWYGILPIFTPKEISKHWKYINGTSFIYKGEGYRITTNRMNFAVSEDELVNNWNNLIWKKLVQNIIKDEINIKYGYNIIYEIGFGIDKPSSYYNSFVRGRKLEITNWIDCKV